MPSINIMVSSEEKDYLAGVASVAGLSLSGFLMMAAIREAHRVLGPPKLAFDNGKLSTPLK